MPFLARLLSDGHLKISIVSPMYGESSDEVSARRLVLSGLSSQSRTLLAQLFRCSRVWSRLWLLSYFSA